MPKQSSKLPPTKDEAEEAVRTLLRYTGEDPDRDGLKETPKRVAAYFLEMTAGSGVDPASFLKTFEEVDYDQMIVVSFIPTVSSCEHHVVGMRGVTHVAYIPNGRIVGLSKFARVVDAFSHQLQVQERLTQSIAKCVHNTLKPIGTGVIMQLSHSCMTMRGIKAYGSITTTSCLLGGLRKPAARNEFLKLVEMSSKTSI